MSHESIGKSDEWYTPGYVFDALRCKFDLDVCGAKYGVQPANLYCVSAIHSNSLSTKWNGFVWCNPPFGGRNGIVPWINKFVEHGNGIFLSPDRTSCDWWQDFADKADAILFVRHKIKFIRPDGSEGKQPSNGTTLFAIGAKGVQALEKAQRNGLGILLKK